MKKFLAGLLTLWCATASAQPVQQSGVITPGHAACWAITGVIFDCGAPGGGVSVVGSTTTNDLVAFNASGSLIDSGINPANTSNISGLWNFNGGATAPTRPFGDNSTNVATTAYVQNVLSGASIISGNIIFNGTATFNGNVLFTAFNAQTATLTGVLSGGSIFEQTVTLGGSSGIGSTNAYLVSADTQSCLFCNNIDVTWNYGGAVVRGNRNAGYFWTVQTAPNSGSGATAGVGVGAIGQTNTGDGGGSGTETGTYFGANTIVRATGFVQNAFSLEADVQTDSSYRGLYSAGVTATNYEAHQATALDTGFVIYSGGQISAANGGGPWGPGVGFHCGLCFAELSRNALVPIDSTGTLVGSYWSSISPPTVALGIDFGDGSSTGFNFSTGAFRSKGFLVDGSGNVTGNTLIVGGNKWISLTSNQLSYESNSVEVLRLTNAFATFVASANIGWVASSTPSSGSIDTALCRASAGTVEIGTSSTCNALGNLAAASATFSGQLISTFGATSIASGACGATTNGTVAGTNASGLITIGAANTTTCTVSFSTTITAPGACVIFPANGTAAAQGTTLARVSSVGTTNFVITGAANQLASTSYYYICL